VPPTAWHDLTGSNQCFGLQAAMRLKMDWNSGQDFVTERAETYSRVDE
jgi:hypothetical protein